MTLTLPSYRIRFLHLTAVWAYAVSQPVFALIDGNPDIILSRDATRFSVALFAVLVTVVPPALVSRVRMARRRGSRLGSATASISSPLPFPSRPSWLA